ncbi:hypothetical protein ACEYW6_21475 [Nostoc sp. UIC 10607]
MSNLADRDRLYATIEQEKGGIDILPMQAGENLSLLAQYAWVKA